MVSGSRTKNRLSKAEQSRQTRSRILTAAGRLFIRDGFLTATMAAIAAEAGVAVQTLYLSFGNKTTILKAAFDEALAGDDEPVPLRERVWMREVFENPDGVAALTTFVDNACVVMQRVGALYGVIRAAAADPDIAELLADNKAERYAVFAAVVESLSTKAGFTTELSVTEAAAVLYTVQSEESYALMVTERGLPVDRWREWALRTMCAELFPAPPRGRARGRAHARVTKVKA